MTVVKIDAVWDKLDENKKQVLSRYEILFDLDDIGYMGNTHNELRRCRLWGDTFLYIGLVVWGVIGGSLMFITGILWNNGRNLSWGILLLLMGVPYAILQGRFIRRSFFILYYDGVAVVIPSRSKRKKLFGKRYWFTYIPFSCVTDYEIKKINKDFKSILFYTKDRKVWPDAEIGITFDKSKSRKEFAEAVLQQYEKWKSEHSEK